MGAVLGLLFGSGAVLVMLAVTGSGGGAQRSRPVGRLTRMVQASGIPRLTVGTLLGMCAAAALVVGVAALLITAVPVVAGMGAIAAGYLPVLLIRRRASQRTRALRRAWPDAVDGLVSGVRAGMSLPVAVCELGEKGPEPLRPAFTRCAAEYLATGSFGQALDVLQADLADPIADRVVAALRIARDVGGNDLGNVLRSLSALLREDARTRGDIEAKQSWTVNAARLAVAAPWVTLALLCTRPEAVRAYGSAQGALVLLIAAVMSLAAYRAMIAIGRLPVEVRVVRS
ncbi:MAG: type II secretion system F family protein [Actinomycetales bacterium]|nr:type II secretion system F family protein [Actinomycetales bacterium]